MKCNVCKSEGKSLHRTNPLGSEDAGWTCKDCIKKTEPELANNIELDDLFDIMDIIDDWNKDRK